MDSFARQQRRSGRVDDHEVGLAARQQIAHHPVQPHGLRSTGGVLPPQVLWR